MSALTACIGAEQWQHALVLWETLEAGDRVLVLQYLCVTLMFVKQTQKPKSLISLQEKERAIISDCY